MSAKKSRILVLDHVSPRGVEVMSAEPSFEIVVKPPMKETELVAEISGFDALVVRSQTKVGRAAIAAAPRLKVIGRAGVGVDNVDVDAATERGVIVMNTPGGNTISTAEHAFSLMLSMARCIPQAHASMRDGKWDRKSFTGVEIYNKTLGIIGLGRIGSEFARRAIAFGMRVLAHDPFTSLSRARSLQVEMVELDDLFARADVITVHMPLSERTKAMVGRDAFAKMKKGVRVINCARGGIVDEAALADALREGKVAAAALDVFEQEPPPADHPLRAFPQVVMTPHLGASTNEAQESVGIEIAEAIRDFLLSGEVHNAVNVPNVDARTLAVIRPWLRLAERLGRGVSQLAPDRVEDLAVSYSGAIGEVNTQPITRLVVKGFLERISGCDVNPVNAMVTAAALGIRIVENRVCALGSYSEILQVSAQRGKDSACMTATFFGSADNPRIVRINDRTVEAAPEGVLLLFANDDRPGIIGHIGTILGHHKINIASMTLSREKLGGPAVTALNLDSEPSAEVLKEVSTHPTIHWVKVVKL
ncbi:MAG: phosphoglycerate dehydrogenase [Verrucomicrobiae bacterium]|nr:phosphoglycerate dehydrogenase [Verrucomicrobiae bacterium]